MSDTDLDLPLNATAIAHWDLSTEPVTVCIAPTGMLAADLLTDLSHAPALVLDVQIPPDDHPLAAPGEHALGALHIDRSDAPVDGPHRSCVMVSLCLGCAEPLLDALLTGHDAQLSVHTALPNTPAALMADLPDQDRRPPGKHTALRLRDLAAAQQATRTGRSRLTSSI